MSNAYGGAGVSLNYRGTNALNPANVFYAKVDPKTSNRSASLGDFWLNTETMSLFVLVSLEASEESDGVQVAEWVKITSSSGGGPLLNLEGNTGTALPNSSGTIQVLVPTGNGTALFTGTGNQLQLTFDDTGNGNLGIGGGTLANRTTGDSNTVIGTLTGNDLTTGNSNTGVGSQAMGVTTGSFNTGIGTISLANFTSGSFNTCLGFASGRTYTSSESSNILIGYNVLGTLGESNVLRIGNASGTGNGAINATFIQGISGVSVANKQSVTINTSTGQLGSQASPASVSFSAYKSAATTNVTGDGTDYTVIFDQTIYNVGSAYNTSTGIFTAPSTGIYEFNFAVFLSSIAAGHTAMTMFIQTTSANFSGPLINPEVVAVSGSFATTMSVGVSMTQGDTARVVVAVDNSTKTVGVFGQALSSGAVTYFSGYLVG